MVGRRHQRRRGRDGFVLVLALLLLGAISGALVALLEETRATATDVDRLVEEARARGVAQAAIVRAAGSVTAAEDPMRGAPLTRARPLRWRFEGMDVDLSIEAEGDKVDVNAGHLDLVTAVLAREDLETAARADLLERIRRARTRGEIFPSVRALLMPCARMSTTAARLEERLTVVTRAQGIQLGRTEGANFDLIPSLTQVDRYVISQALDSGRLPLDDQRLVHLRPYMSFDTSYYRFAGRVHGRDGGVILERQLMAELSVTRPHVRAISGTWLRHEHTDFCE